MPRLVAKMDVVFCLEPSSADHRTVTLSVAMSQLDSLKSEPSVSKLKPYNVCSRSVWAGPSQLQGCLSFKAPDSFHLIGLPHSTGDFLDGTGKT